MGYRKIRAIVIGGLNTDIIAAGVHGLLRSGELTRSGTLAVGPGGKSRNIAQMMARLMGRGSVAMAGRTSKDPFGLWKVPLEALKAAGVDVSCIKIESFRKAGKYPGVALIPVTASGENQIYCVPGINDDFSPDDIDACGRLFDAAARNGGILAFSLEQPMETALHAVRKARSLGLRVALDPGGIDPGEDYRELLAAGIFMIKPNEHEVKILTGVPVRDMSSARRAARALFKMGAGNVMITLGKRGAYLIGGDVEEHIPVRETGLAGPVDETGCGDQAMAALCAGIVSGKGIREAARRAIAAGTMQFHRVGVDPVTRQELENVLMRRN